MKVPIEQLLDFIPAHLLLRDRHSLSTYGRDWLKDYTPNPLAVVLPENADQVQKVVSWCYENHVALVPSGGRTGLSGGATALQEELVISFERLRQIREVDPVGRTVTCDAGVVTQKLIEEVEKNGLYFPVEFTSIGSSHIGGNIATNAGGIRVIRYGSMREWVLGLEVITGRGEQLNLNGSLVKNNTGYDLKSLFVGSEGTLGVIVGATLKLTTPPGELIRAFCALPSLHSVLELLKRTRDLFPELSAFEILDRFSLSEVVKHKQAKDPFTTEYPYYAVMEFERGSAELRDRIVEGLGSFSEKNLIRDAVLSENMAQATQLMNLREWIGEVLASHYTVHKNDISVPVAQVPHFLSALQARIVTTYPTFRVAVFGHVGDGNLHVNVVKPSNLTDEAFFAECKKADHEMFEVVSEYRGSISAEHGVGLLKKEFLKYSRSAAEIELMKSIKKVFDPRGIMNPGKIFT